MLPSGPSLFYLRRPGQTRSSRQSCLSGRVGLPRQRYTWAQRWWPGQGCLSQRWLLAWRWSWSSRCGICCNVSTVAVTASAAIALCHKNYYKILQLLYILVHLTLGLGTDETEWFSSRPFNDINRRVVPSYIWSPKVRKQSTPSHP